MTISRDEFLRILPGATDCVPRSAGADAWCGADVACGWSLRIEPLPGLALGALHLPRHRVRLRLDDCEPGARNRFLARWELHFRRGGG